jgi:threonine/homoserine/homoserine lactone efflux protein
LQSLLVLFTSSFVITLSGALMPGPLLTLTISESPRRGFWTGPLLIAGHGILEIALIVLLLIGLGPYLQKDWVFGIIGSVGALIMGWMACGMFRTVPDVSMEEGSREASGRNPLLSGIFLSVANPYWSLWWATIGLGYLMLAWKQGMVGLIFFFSGHILADLLWYSIISFGFSKGKNFIPRKVHQGLILTCASAMAFFAVWFAVEGVGKLFF